MTLTNNLREYIAACFTGLWVQSHEHDDAIAEIARLCRDEDLRLAVWDVAGGLQIPGNGETDVAATDPLAAISAVNALASPDSSALLVLVNFHKFLGSPEIIQTLAGQITRGKQNRTFVIVLAPVVQIPAELEKHFVVVEQTQARERRITPAPALFWNTSAAASQQRRIASGLPTCSSQFWRCLKSAQPSESM